MVASSKIYTVENALHIGRIFSSSLCQTEQNKTETNHKIISDGINDDENKKWTTEMKIHIDFGTLVIIYK